MAIALDLATNGGTTPTGTTLTFSHTCTGSNLILFVGAAGGSTFLDDITGAKYNNVSMTQVDKKQIPGDRFIYLFYLLNPATGANNVVITSTDSASFIGGSAVSYSGVKQSGQPDNSVTNSHFGSGNLTGTLTTVADNCWTVMAGEFAGGNMGAGAGSTLRVTNAPMMFDSNGVITPAGSTSMTGNATGSSALIMASFSPLISGTTLTINRPAIMISI